jgi:hypothetical protein
MADEARSGDGITGYPAPEPADGHAWWAGPLRCVRWLLGALTLVGGFTWVLLNMHGPSAVLDGAAGCVLVAGALVLLMPHRIRLPRRPTAVAVVVAALAGTAVGLAGKAERVCCQYGYFVDRGWPFRWAQRGAIAGDPDAAFRLTQDADWHLDLVSLAVDLLLWAYAGMLVVVLVVLVRRRRQ